MNWLFTHAKCAEAAPAAPYQPPPGAAVSALPKKTDFMDLPLPVKYEELQREIMSESPGRRTQANQYFTFWGYARDPSNLEMSVRVIQGLRERNAIPEYATGNGGGDAPPPCPPRVTPPPPRSRTPYPKSKNSQKTHRPPKKKTHLLLLPFSPPPSTFLPSPPRHARKKNRRVTSTVSLKADHFEGGRFDFNKQLNQKFFLSHSIFMGSIEVPAQGNQIIKIPNATYEFGANVVDTNYMLVGRVLTDGRMSGRLKYDLSDALSAKLQTSKEPGFSQVMVDLDYKGLDTQAQLKLGNGGGSGACDTLTEWWLTHR